MKQYTGCYVRLPEGYSTVYAEAGDRMTKVEHSVERVGNRYVMLCKGGNKPDIPEGKRLVYVYSIDEDGDCVKTYLVLNEGEALPADVPTAPPRRVFETADLIEALMDEGVWESAKAWIVDKDILDLVLATKEFDENNQNFQAGKSALQAQLGWSDEEVEEFLDRCAKD